MAVNSTNYKFNTPTTGTEEDTWGDKLNENWDKMDSLLYGASYTDGDGNTVEQIQPDLAEGSWAIAGTAVTSTAAELNILDGVTATTAELNILDGVTSTTAELNVLDGVTATATELNILDGVTATTAELNILDGVTSSASELNILDGVTATSSELNVLDGNTSTTATTVAGEDGVVMNDAGTMKQVPMTNVATFVNSQITSLDLDSLDAGAIRIASSSNKITTIGSGTDLILEPDTYGNIELQTDTVLIEFDDFGTGASAPNPHLDFYNSSNSPASNDSSGGVYFYGKDSNNVKRAYGSIDSLVDVPTAGAIDGKIVISVAEDGTVAGYANPKLTISSTTVKVEDNFVIGTSTSVDSIKDEDTMSSDSATALATQQSIKAYVDSKPSFPTVVHIPPYYETGTNGPDYFSNSASGSNTALSITGTVPTGATHAIISGTFAHVSQTASNNIKVSLDNGTTYTGNLSDWSTSNVPYFRQLFFALSDAGVSAGDSYTLIIHWDAAGGSSNAGNYALIYDGLLTWVVT